MISYKLSHRQQDKVQILILLSLIWALFSLKIFPKMRMSIKCRHNNNSDNLLTSRRTDEGKKIWGAFLNNLSMSLARTYKVEFETSSCPGSLQNHGSVLFHITPLHKDYIPNWSYAFKLVCNCIIISIFKGCNYRFVLPSFCIRKLPSCGRNISHIFQSPAQILFFKILNEFKSRKCVMFAFFRTFFL